MTSTRTDDTPYRIQDVLRRGTATWGQIISAPEFAGPVGGSIPVAFIGAALLDLIDAGTVNVSRNDDGTTVATLAP